MDSCYCETKFLNDFMKLYDSSDEYDYTILFDNFYHDFVNDNTTEFIKSVHQYYYQIDDDNDNDDDDLDEEVLFQTLYTQIEKMMCDKYESEADTDTDE